MPQAMTPIAASDGSASSGERTAGWLTAARQLLDLLGETQMEVIDATAARCADAIAAGGLVHLFGTGHSRIPLEETFPRYGSYPGFHPMAELSMTFHTQVTGSNGQRQAMYIERVEGLAEAILDNFSFGSSDVMIVWSAGGRTAVPIEMAMGARRRGLVVVAVTSVAQATGFPSGHSSGTSLVDHADLVIDLCIPVGDAAIAIEGLDTPVGPLSSVANVAIANEIKVRTARLLVERGAMPPVITSASVVGAERSAKLFDAAYADHAARYAAVLAR